MFVWLMKQKYKSLYLLVLKAIVNFKSDTLGIYCHHVSDLLLHFISLHSFMDDCPITFLKDY